MALTRPGFIRPMPPYKDKRVKSLSWFFRFSIPTGISENLGDFVLGLFRGREQYRLIDFAALSAYCIVFRSTASSDPNVVCGFVRGSTVIAESAVSEWRPGNEDTSGVKIEWTPIHGRFEKYFRNIWSAINALLLSRGMV